ncbi:MAG: rhomboid family intramembrane serine protease [Myxococcales bacterium]|nr:rhomboid family intramembrane serine protease [Myxococcales bacterium]
MFFFLPIGHDQSVRRMPWVTAALLFLCIVAYGLQLTFAVNPETVKNSLERQHKYEVFLVKRYLAPPPPAPPRTAPLTEEEVVRFLADVRAHQVGVGDPYVDTLLEIDAALDRLVAADPVRRFGYRPKDGFSVGVLTHGFLHGGVLHLLGNMVFLWLAGCTVEARWGSLPYLGLYLASLLGSALAYRLVHPGSEVILIGASGAIAGAMAAFFISFVRARVRFWYFVWLFVFVRAGTFALPALVVFPVWFGSQLVQLFFEAHGHGTAVAYSAHVGGFVVGAAIAGVVRGTGLEKRWVDEFTRIEEEVLAEGGRVTFAAPSLDERRRGGAPRRAPIDVAPIDLSSSEGVHSPRTAPVGHVSVVERLDDDAAPMASRDPSSADARRARFRITPALRGEAPAVPAVHSSFDLDALAAFEEALAHADLATMERLAPTALRRFAEGGRWVDAALAFRALMGLEVPLSDRSLALGTRAAAEAGDVRLAVRAVARLQDEWPGSPSLAQALWDVARAQSTAGHPELAEKTLRRLIEEHPGDPHAELARKYVG